MSTAYCDMCERSVQKMDRVLEVSLLDENSELVYFRFMVLCKACERLFLKRLREACP